MPRDGVCPLDCEDVRGLRQHDQFGLGHTGADVLHHGHGCRRIGRASDDEVGARSSALLAPQVHVPDRLAAGRIAPRVILQKARAQQCDRLQGTRPRSPA